MLSCAIDRNIKTLPPAFKCAFQIGDSRLIFGFGEDFFVRTTDDLFAPYAHGAFKRLIDELDPIITINISNHGWNVVGVDPNCLLGLS